MPPVEHTSSSSPTPPKGDPRRQATGALRGFDYQIWQSVDLWTQLGQGEVLFLEAAEDVDRATDGAVEAGQVKALAQPLTLRSSAVRDAVRNYWDLRARNPGLEVTLALITTATRGVEIDRPFGATAGLDEWDRCRSEGADVGPLRAFLASLDLGSDVAAFFRSATDAEVRDRLLKPVRWVTAQPGREGLRDLIEERLIHHGDRLGLSPSQSSPAVDILYARAWDVVTSHPPRKLDRIGFLKTFQDATAVLTPRSVLATPTGTGTSASDSGRVPRPESDAAAELAAILAVGDEVGGLRATLERFAAERDFSPGFKEALHQPVFDELTHLLACNDAEGALALADRCTASLDAVIEQEGHPSERYADALRGYRQRLLFAGANAASWLMRSDIAADRARRAFSLGPVHTDRHPQAVQAAFNAGLPDDLGRLVSQMGPDAKERPRAEALLCVLKHDWEGAAQRLDKIADPGLSGLRAQVEVARLDAADPDVVRAAAERLDLLERDARLPVDVLNLAQTSIHLLDRVLNGRTPLAFDRRPLTDAVRQRAEATVKITPPGTRLRAHAVAALSDASRTLHDPALREHFRAEIDALPDSVRSEVFVLWGTPPTLDSIEAERVAGRLDDVSAALLTAQIQREGDSGAAEKTLREALFKTPDEAARTPVLEALVDTLREANRDSDAEALLALTPIPEGDLWLLRQRDSVPLDLNGAEAFPLDVKILRYVVSRLIAETQARDAQGPVPEASDMAAPDTPEVLLKDSRRPSAWTQRLVEVLPSQSSWISHAEALIYEADYDGALYAVRHLGSDYAERAAGLEATVWDSMGQPDEAARVLMDAVVAFPQSTRFAINASALLLSLDRADEAVDLLATRVTEETRSVGLLVNYAAALLQQNPGDSSVSSQAFDLLRRAYDEKPSKQLAMEVWMAARGAKRENEAAEHFRAMTAGAAHVNIQTREDAERALAGHDGSGFTAFTGDFTLFTEVIGEQVQKQRKTTDALDQILTAHALAYVDTFRVSGHAWENWTRWSDEAVKRGEAGRYAVLADWPSSVFVHRRRTDPAPAGVYADITALLTLGVLGPATASAVIRGAGPVHIARGTFEELQRELVRIRQDVALGQYPGEAEAVERFQGSGAVIPYDADVEASAPDAELGAARVDVGVALWLGGRYVSDVDAADIACRVSSASLLATLNAEGRVEKAAADQAALAYPHTFGGWEQAPSLSEVPGALVFDQFAISTWTASGLIDAVEGAVRIGPWAWTEIESNSRARAFRIRAYERLKSTIGVLRDASNAGDVLEVEPVVDEVISDGGEDAGNDNLEDIWAHALRSVRTSRALGLQLWADDRFYPLLLWMGGPTIGGPETEAIRASLLDDAERPLPTPTVDLVARLARDGGMPEEEARRIAGELFDAGYRPAHPLVLTDAINRFALPEGGPLRGRFRAIARSITEIPDYLPDTIDEERRQGFSRVAASEIAEQLVVTAWTHPGLTNAQRRLLADAFLDAVETVFHQQRPAPGDLRSDRTRLLFWRGLSSTLIMTAFEGQDGAELQRDALRWLGDAAARRPDPHGDIVRLLEDNAQSVAQLTPSIEHIESALPPGSPIDAEQARVDAVGRLALRALIPLVGSQLVDRLDPLLRRIVGRLARLERQGCIDTVYGFVRDGVELTVVVSEEEEDAAAVGLVRRVAGGDASLANLIHPTHVAFVYNRRPPQDWIDAGIPPDETHPVTVERSLFVLLWGDARDVYPVVINHLVYHLSRIDPPLALLVFDAASGPLGSDEADVERAKDTLALGLLESGLYELQRDLVHAMWRLRDWPNDRLERFLGWLGKEEIERLVSIDPEVAHRLVHLGNIVVSQGHFLGRQLLTDTFDDAAAVLGAVAASMPGAETPPIPDLGAWVVHRMETAETHEDPFVAACALRHVLLASECLGSTLPDLPGCTDAVARIQRYLRTTLSAPDPEENVLTHRVALRGRLASASIRLAAFVCQGRVHVEAYNAASDPLAEWLDHVWLLATRLIESLPALLGGLEMAAAEAERAAHDLGLDTLSVVVADAFDPFSLAGSGSVDRVLTLYAMLTSMPSAPGFHPVWWSAEIDTLLNEVAAQEDRAHHLPADQLGNRFGTRFPLRERELARSILRRCGRSSEDHEGGSLGD